MDGEKKYSFFYPLIPLFFNSVINFIMAYLVLLTKYYFYKKFKKTAKNKSIQAFRQIINGCLFHGY